jgi:hypothetical protein
MMTKFGTPVPISITDDVAIYSVPSDGSLTGDVTIYSVPDYDRDADPYPHTITTSGSTIFLPMQEKVTEFDFKTDIAEIKALLQEVLAELKKSKEASK